MCGIMLLNMDFIVAVGGNFVPYGYGTNAAKENVLLWCDNKVYNQAMEYAACGADPNWKITPLRKQRIR